MSNIHKKIDCIGLFCPMPIVRIRDAIRDLPLGEVLEMVADDPTAEADMKSWSKRTGHELLEISRDGAIYRFLVKKCR